MRWQRRFIASLLAVGFCLSAMFGGAWTNAVLAADTGEIVEPDGYRMDNYRSPVPATLKGAKTIDIDEALALWRDKAAVFIDVYPQAPKPPNLPKNTVWREPVHMSI